MAYKTVVKELQKEVDRLRGSGIVLPKNPHRALESARQMQNMVSDRGSLQSDVKSMLENWRSADRTISTDEIRSIEQNTALAAAMGRQRRMSSVRKTAGGGNDVAVAIPRFYDPLEYWDLTGLPWNMADEGHRHKLHKWLRLYYATHRLVPTLIDIYTRFPLIGLELKSKDSKIADFYSDLFLNDLKYEEFLVSLGREYWLTGEAFPLASFNENLGVWEREELLNPEDIVVENFPLLGTRQLKVVPPEYLKRLATTKSPPDMYKQLEINYPDLIPYLRRGEPFPVSDVLLKQLAFRVTDWDDHGTPIMLRGLRTLMHEEKLLASQDAIAERLYSPLILAKLGINNVGADEGPWIPGADQLDSFRDDMDVALSMDFRLMVYHYALEIENVFGREQVPDLWNDFDRVSNWLMQIFGLQGLLSTGDSAQPYATSALNAEMMNQMLKTWQNSLSTHMEDRMSVVAEAQEHYDYEKKGQSRIPIMEEVIEYDEEGNIHIVERHKLLIPDVKFAALDLRDEATERQFLQSLRAMGVPVSDEKLMVNVDFEFKDTLDEMQEEMIQKTVAQQMAKLQTYKILRIQGLSVPPELQAEIEGGGAGGPEGMPGGGPGGMGGPSGGGMGAPGPSGGGGGGIMMPPMPGGLGPGGIGGSVPGGGSPPGSPISPGSAGTIPQVSNERRPGMPTANVRLARAAMKQAGVSDEDINLYESLSDDEIDSRIAHCQQQISEIEFRKRMTKTANEYKLEIISAEDDGIEWSGEIAMQKAASGQKIVIDRVPPKVRRDFG